DLTNYKILLYHYPYTTKELEIMIWDKMDTVDSRFAVKLTIGGVNDSGEYDDTSWDLFFLEPKLEEKIDLMLDKYETQYVKTDYTELLGQKREEFTEEFMFKLLEFLNKNLTIDDVLDRILEVGVENITIFEKFYLDQNIEIRKK
ncbi:MAG: hypothetical protein ACK55Z_37295, partial [bacterium]